MPNAEFMNLILVQTYLTIAVLLRYTVSLIDLEMTQDLALRSCLGVKYTVLCSLQVNFITELAL